MNKNRLLKNAQYHHRKANELYYKLEMIERREQLIGFKTRNDNRMSSDRYEIELKPLEDKWGY